MIADERKEDAAPDTDSIANVASPIAPNVTDGYRDGFWSLQNPCER